MAEPFDAARFATLIAAYGAEPRRWPDEERDAAQAFARADARAAALLDGAADLDDLLSTHRVARPSAALHVAVLAAAPRRPPFLAQARVWWTMLALGLAGAGGALAGSAATAALAPVPAHMLYGPDEATTSSDGAPESGS